MALWSAARTRPHVVVIASAIALVVAVTLGVVFLAGAPWIYEGEPQLTRIDPINNALAESIPLPLAGGFVRSTGETIFYEAVEEGVHRLLSGASEFE